MVTFGRRFSISIFSMADKKKPSPRRGRAVKAKKGEAAQFESGDAAGPKTFDPEEVAARLNLWWENEGGTSFIVGDVSSGVWSTWPEKSINNLLKMNYVRFRTREGEPLSEAAQVLMHVMMARRLELALSAVSGYPAGIYDINGRRILVRTSPQLVKPVEGEWPTVHDLLHAKLDFSWGNEEGHGVDQTEYFHGWMKTALEGLYLGGPGNFRPGQCCIFAGAADSGKSRIQNQIITGLLGGRSADPGPYLFGRTDFNGEMFAAEHLMMEDPASSTKTVDRIYFGEMLKQLVVNDNQRLHDKRETAVTVSPFFRVTISINDDPDKMRVLPLLTPDFKDKVHLFMVSPHPLPMPTNTLDERQAFRAKVTSELPAYAWWLLNVFQVSDRLRSARFGVKEWHHPTLAVELFDDTPAAELLQIIDAAEFTSVDEKLKLWDLYDEDNAARRGKEWEGTAIALERLLLSPNCSLDREAKRLCAHNKVDRLLGRLKEDQPHRVRPHRTNSVRNWVITCPS